MYESSIECEYNGRVMPVVARYSEDDPYALILTITASGGDINLDLSREVVSEALNTGRGGVGVIRMVSGENDFYVNLVQCGESHSLKFSKDDIDRIAQETEDIFISNISKFSSSLDDELAALFLEEAELDVDPQE